MTNFDVDLTACRGRQNRLLQEVEPLGSDLVVLTRHESIQWLTGAYVGQPYAPAAAMTGDGRVTLMLPQRQLETNAAVDNLVGYEAKWHSTLRDDQRAASSAILVDVTERPPRRVACEFSSYPQHLASAWPAEMVDVEPTLFRLRRRKDPDELAMLARANDANRAMFQHARDVVRPGISELEVYTVLQAVAVHELGEALTYFGQDFQCNSRGGLPRNRVAQSGELYILDLGVGFRGYYSDNARTIAVDRRPTDQQQRAWSKIVEVFPLIANRVCPGASCRALFNEVQELLDSCRPWVFNHHLGHGVGLAPHEGPHLNPNWDDTFDVGDHFTVEPGLYHEELRHGIRLEQNYVVTPTGVELLTDWPLDL